MNVQDVISSMEKDLIEIAKKREEEDKWITELLVDVAERWPSDKAIVTIEVTYDCQDERIYFCLNDEDEEYNSIEGWCHECFPARADLGEELDIAYRVSFGVLQEMLKSRMRDLRFKVSCV